MSLLQYLFQPFKLFVQGPCVAKTPVERTRDAPNALHLRRCWVLSVLGLGLIVFCADNKSVAQTVFAPQGVIQDQPLASFEISSSNQTNFSCGEIADEFPHQSNRVLSVVKNRFGCTDEIRIRPEDEIWVVSARQYEGARTFDGLQVQQLRETEWEAASMEALTASHQTQRDLTTIVYVHGNQTNYDYGVARGIQFYSNIVARSQSLSPIRVVLWLWKSERELPRLYTDYLVKSRRAIGVGRALSETLTALGDNRVLVVGFSLGAQVVFSALDSMEQAYCHQFCGIPAFENARQMLPETTSTEKLRVALITPAVNPAYACEIADREANACLTSCTSVFQNRSDSALKAFQIALRRQCPQKKISMEDLIDDGRLPLGKVRWIDLTRQSGVAHSIVRYSQTDGFGKEVTRLLGQLETINSTKIVEVN